MKGKILTSFVVFGVCFANHGLAITITNNGVWTGSGIVLNAGDILVNNGTIDSSYSVGVGAGTAYIENAGVFNSVVYGTNSTSTITQFVGNKNELNLVPTDSTVQLNVLINDGDEYNLSTLKSMSLNANEVRINFDTGLGTNPVAMLVADSGFDGVFNVPIIKESGTQIKLKGEFLDNVSGDEVLRFNSLSTLGIINIIDETDSGVYVYNWATCSDGMGLCVKRSYSSAYLSAQQNAHYAGLVASIGVQNNPKKLLQPMSLVNHYELLSFYDFSDDLFISVNPEYYIAKDFQNAGIRINSGTKFGGRLSVGVGAYVIKSAFKNEVSDYKSDVYGGNLRFNYDINEVLFLRGIMGLSFSSIDCQNVKSGDGTVNNPNAIGLYGGADFGAKFNLESGLYLSPFIGYNASSESVVDVHQNNNFLRLGNDVGFRYFMDGVTYSYILRTGINSDGYFDVGVGFGAWAVSDKVGGSLSVGVMNTDFGLSGKVSVNARFAF